MAFFRINLTCRRKFFEINNKKIANLKINIPDE